MRAVARAGCGRRAVRGGNCRYVAHAGFGRCAADWPASATRAEPIKDARPVYFPQLREFRPTTVYDRYALLPGAAFDGPAIVEER